MTVTDVLGSGQKPAVSVVGIGVEYPPSKQGPEFAEALALRHYDPTPALQKTLEINRKSRIEYRYSVLDPDHEYWHQHQVPTIRECDVIFKQYGIPLAVDACNKAIEDWGGLPAEITHVVAVTCTNTSNPGFDGPVCQRLGLRNNTRRVLLHGVGCGGGLAAIRVAQEMLLGATQQGKPARALIISCELPTIFTRTELDSMSKEQRPNVALGLFGDCAAALVLSNGIGVKREERVPIWDVLNCETTHLEGSEGLGEYKIGPNGYVAKIDKKIPLVIGQSIQGGFTNLVTSTPGVASETSNYNPGIYDWAFHPGGYAFLLAAQTVLGLSSYNLRKAFEAYSDGGNTVSSTVISILNRLKKERESGVKDEEQQGDRFTSGKGADKVIAVAFGHGLTMEMIMFSKLAPPATA
ncbi:thiolase-like protein [Aspergillus pseudotamarii]|uniref:Thiolase-like protein n=1 Tax=Aspergillus pseudotamarii TaxID=132259 RepID=A0A5N6TB57_ASPPS|nr:thiolase-like protein [Aspergillus pseudotamarii]KAE8143615.1 thiolase-like protein [Aspergillus pseudotamarii]